MAQASAIQTYNLTTNREDLGDVIYNISKDETPFLSGLGKTKATNTYHEWVQDALAAPADNAAIEGADFSFAKRTTPTRLGNFTQIFTTTVEVSDTQRDVNPAGYADDFAYQMEKAMKEHATDIETALINGTGNSGASGTARRLKGILPFITTTINTGTATGTGTAAETLTEDMFNDTLEDIWEEGGRPNSVYVNGTLKRAISGFQGNANQVTVNSAGERLYNTVTYYNSDFGVKRVVLHWLMPAQQVAILQDDMWKVSVLRPTHKVGDVAKVGDSTRGVILTELTLEAREEASSGKILDVKG